jgi:hypothetical protein
MNCHIGLPWKILSPQALAEKNGPKGLAFFTPWDAGILTLVTF